ncbi:MAG: ribonuclease P protein component [Dehalococcoidia bacterium]|nr:ribonuclease P protein component [Dehalococcoidia bacterium]
MKNKNSTKLYKADFKEIYDNGKYITTRYVKLNFIFNNTDHMRVAFAINRKQGNAVERNKIKRKIKSIVSTIETKPNIDVLIQIKPVIKSASFTDIKSDLQGVISSIAS